MSTPKRTTMDKITTSRAKMLALSGQIDAESAVFDSLWEELRTEIQTKTGLNGIQLSIGTVIPQSQKNKVVFNTIQTLRNSGLSFDEVAVKLHIRGFKTESLDIWTGALTKEFFESCQEDKPRVMRA